MCMSTPKPKKVEEKPVQWLRNPLLDRLGIGSGLARGRASLRTDLGTAGAAYVNPYTKAPAAIAPPGASPTAGSGTGLAIPTAPRIGGGGGGPRGMARTQIK